MKIYILFLAMPSLLIGCTQHGSESTTTNNETLVVTPVDPSAITKKGDTLIVKPGNNNDLPSLTSGELTDDSVFADGSRPTSWRNAGVSNILDCKLFIKKLQMLASSNKKEILAEQIHYPLNKGIKTPKDFLAAYEKLFTPKVKVALAAVNFSQIFRNSQGVMIGDGEIWIAQEGNAFKIIAINN